MHLIEVQEATTLKINEAALNLDGDGLTDVWETQNPTQTLKRPQLQNVNELRIVASLDSSPSVPAFVSVLLLFLKSKTKPYFRVETLCSKASVCVRTWVRWWHHTLPLCLELFSKKTAATKPTVCVHGASFCFSPNSLCMCCKLAGTQEAVCRCMARRLYQCGRDFRCVTFQAWLHR